MQKYKRFVSGLICVLLTLSVLVGCEKEDGSKKDPSLGSLESETLIFDKREIKGNSDLQILTYQSSVGWSDSVTELYKKLYGGNVEFTKVSWSNRVTELALLASADSLPDVLIGFYEYDFPKFIDIGIFGEIGDDEFDFENSVLYSGCINSILTRNSVKYGIATKDSPEVIIYNKDYITERGCKTPWELYKEGKWDWFELKNLAKKLSYDADNDGIIDHYGISAWSLKALYASNNTWPIVKNDGKVILNIDSKPIIDTLQFVYDMVNIDKSMPKNIYTAETGFSAGRVAMYIEKTDVINSSRTSGLNPESVEIAPLPKGDNATEYITYVAPQIYGVSSTCKNKSAALAYLECYLSIKYPKNTDGEKYSSYSSQQLEVIDIVNNNTALVFEPTGYGKLDTYLTNLYQSVAGGTTVSDSIANYSEKFENELFSK